MKAVQIHRYGDIDELVYEEVEKPVPVAGEVVIRVHAAGVNPAEPHTRQGLGAFYLPSNPFPLILGSDFSGEVVALSPGLATHKFKLGDEVYGMVHFPFIGHTYAEYITAPVHEISLKPRNVDHQHAAALPMVALTAWQAVFDHAKIQAGQTVLIKGASGGVGHIAVQLAKGIGARVIGVSSGRNKAFVEGLGIDQFIDYTTTSIAEAAKNVDVVIDTVGGDGNELLDVLSPGGRIVSVYYGDFDKERIAARNAQVFLMSVYIDTFQLTEIARLVDEGKIRVHLDEVFPLKEAKKANQIVEAGHVRGKIVLTVNE